MRLLDPGTLNLEPPVGLDRMETQPSPGAIAIRVEGDADASRLLGQIQEGGPVIIAFPAFRDGRGFSLAAKLRAAGFAGELIATGDLLPDQALFLARCGFDAVELPPGASRGEWEAGLAAFTASYQPAARPATTVWDLRQRPPRRASSPAAPGVQDLNARFRDASAERLLEHVIRREFAGNVALLSSFGAEAAVTLHLVASVDPATPVLFLDTDRHFAPTLQYRDLLVARLGLSDVRVLSPRDAETEDPDGRLWDRDPDRCCEIRKVAPLATIAPEFAALITGRKRVHGGQRSSLPRFDLQDGRIRVNPLADWNAQDVEAYFETYDLPRHPLLQAGYRSIGCWPCSQPTQGRVGDRSGRWAGRSKQECGIHLPFRKAAADLREPKRA